MGHGHDHSGHGHDQGGHGHGGHGHGGHDHGHDHGKADKRTLMWVMLLSGSYMVAEIVGGIVSGSLALLADAGHMALDTVAVVLGLFAIHLSQRPPTSGKSFGYYRAEILIALLNAASLLAASMWIFYEAWERIGQPTQVEGGTMTIVAVGGLVVNMVSIFLMTRANRDSLNMKGVWLHLLQDALGSVAAIVAALLVWKFQWYAADPIISVAIGLLILKGSWQLLANCINVLLIAVPEGVSIEAIKRDVQAVPGVEGLHDLHVWALNTGVNSLTGHVEASANADHGSLLRTITTMLRDKHAIQHVTIQVEGAGFSHGGLRFCAPGTAFRA